MELAQRSPVAIMRQKEEVNALLPSDAKLMSWRDKETYSHREIVGQWSSALLGCYLQLVAYRVL
jgi:hypothetical protein